MEVVLIVAKLRDSKRKTFRNCLNYNYVKITIINYISNVKESIRFKYLNIFYVIYHWQVDISRSVMPNEVQYFGHYKNVVGIDQN